MAKANVTININKVFALSDWSLSEGRFFTSLEDAVNEGRTIEHSNDVGIVEMELQGNEFVPVRWYRADGTLVD